MRAPRSETEICYRAEAVAQRTEKAAAILRHTEAVARQHLVVQIAAGGARNNSATTATATVAATPAAAPVAAGATGGAVMEEKEEVEEVSTVAGVGGVGAPGMGASGVWGGGPGSSSSGGRMGDSASGGGGAGGDGGHAGGGGGDRPAPPDAAPPDVMADLDDGGDPEAANGSVMGVYLEAVTKQLSNEYGGGAAPLLGPLLKDNN